MAKKSVSGVKIKQGNTLRKKIYSHERDSIHSASGWPMHRVVRYNWVNLCAFKILIWTAL